MDESPFLALPLELRERIYLYTFTSTPEPILHRPVEPPLTQVSRQVRDESIPVFYANHTLTIQTYIKCDSYGQILLHTRKWYHDLLRQNLSHIVNFRIRFILVQQYTGELVPLEFQIGLTKRHQSRLPKGQKPWTLTHSFDRAWFRNPHRTGDPADFDDVVMILKGHLVRTLDCLVECPGIGRWTPGDLDRLVKVEAESLPLQTSS